VNFLPTADQLELQRGVRELLDREFPLDRLPAGFDPTLWQALTDTGVFSLRNELGLGMADAVLVFEELGRACVPGPLVATFLAAGAADGPVALVEVGDGPLIAAHLEVASALLVLDGPSTAIAASMPGTALDDPVDPLSPLSELAATPAGNAWGDARRIRSEGAVLTAAIQVGLAARLTELAVAYAKQREQFGRPIGSFQAVKHLCADMFVRAELARAALHAAAVMLDDPSCGDAARAVAGAKLLADEAATANGRACIQVHGGMGFTWEVPVHFFLKRAWLHATEFGTADDHAEDLADLL
jgi:alkylation response protein AidB-like acyl-CoA dehydrogenase